MGMWDSVTSSASSIFGYVGDAANSLGKWAQNNPGGATILGAGIGAAGNYLTQKSSDSAAAKREEDKFNRENARYDQLHQVADVKWGDPVMDAGSVAGGAPLTSGGLLSKMQQTQADYTKKNQAV